MTSTASFSTWTINTPKGGTSGTCREVAAWQAENQGSFASIEFEWGFGDRISSIEFDVDGVDFDADDIQATMLRMIAVRRVAADGCGAVLP